MPDNEYHENSMDATIARIEARQSVNSEKLDRLIDGVAAMEHRLQDLERWKKGLMMLAGFIGFAAAMLKDWLFGGSKN
jgi:hypothetical protein